MIKRYVQRTLSDVPSLADKRVSPHTIRHTTATHLLRSGVDINTIRAWLGHVSINTTNIYAEVDLEMKAKALATCEVRGSVPQKHWKDDVALMQFLRNLWSTLCGVGGRPLKIQSKLHARRHIKWDATEEIKLDGYRALATKDNGKPRLLSRRNNALNDRFPITADALKTLDHGLILDGEVVALDAQGRPSFNLLQHHKANAHAIVYYVFDLLAFRGRDVRQLRFETVARCSTKYYKARASHCAYRQCSKQRQRISSRL
jgi:hypothetical protein